MLFSISKLLPTKSQVGNFNDKKSLTENFQGPLLCFYALPPRQADLLVCRFGDIPVDIPVSLLDCLRSSDSLILRQNGTVVDLDLVREDEHYVLSP